MSAGKHASDGAEDHDGEDAHHDAGVRVRKEIPVIFAVGKVFKRTMTMR